MFGTVIVLGAWIIAMVGALILCVSIGGDPKSNLDRGDRFLVFTGLTILFLAVWGAYVAGTHG